jgi:hypothetical protein
MAEAVAPACEGARTKDEKARQEKIAAALEDESRIQPPSR